MQNLITIQPGDRISLLFVAINHYISTGDHIGEGIALGSGKGSRIEPNEKLMVLIPVNRAMPQDVEDFGKFKSKIESIQSKIPIKLEPQEVSAGMSYYSFKIFHSQVEKLTQLLTESPGPKGWGSPKEIIDKHFPG